MKNLFYILIFCLPYFFSVSVLAQETAQTACQKILRPPKVTISTSFGRLKYDFSKNNRSLTRMHIRQYGGKVATGKYVHGLATYDLSTQINFKMLKNTLNNGSVCIYPQEISLNIGVEDPTIYLSKDLVEGTCVYQLALRHEQTHQQINTEVLENYLPLIKQKFLTAVKQNLLISSSRDMNLQLAQENLKNRYLEAINPVLEEIKAEIKAEQAKLDSLENYDYEQKLCKDKP